ncbi:hypothetical protein PCCS19_11030 [Paenibacillus sp. CCS19]|uniref:hypothetical protein n=1 Tax=Paenibacillus sp. CCS19 TaxID=3158387 RepID=UPI00256B1AD6|nr:hypothetical protein [Paenibacillus cellulosilyticus]GMK38049.1 hypothetical protein PCCS19_11030 [Paenibacillus cellulosilyticus]
MTLLDILRALGRSGRGDCVIRIPKLLSVSVVVIILIALWYQHRLEAEGERRNTIKQLYQAKTDFAFRTFVLETPSFTPLADVLEAISKAKDTDSPVEVQKLLDAAKEQGDRMNARLLLLIEFCDDNTSNADPQLMINRSIMTSSKQQELFALAFRGNIWSIAYNASYRYWKAKPKVLDTRTKGTMADVAEELHNLETTMTSLKEWAEFAARQDDSAADTELKRRFMKDLEPTLTRLADIQEAYNSQPVK